MHGKIGRKTITSSREPQVNDQITQLHESLESLMAIYLSTVFSTFDMDNSGKIRRNHRKKPLKNNKITKLESDLLKTLKIHSSLKSQNFTDACTVGHKLAPHVIQQTSLNFRNFPELYLCSIKTYHVAMKDFP